MCYNTAYLCGWNYHLYTPLADQLSATDLVDLLVMWCRVTSGIYINISCTNPPALTRLHVIQLRRHNVIFVLEMLPRIDLETILSGG